MWVVDGGLTEDLTYAAGDTLRQILSSHNIVLSTESDESFPREHAPFHSPPKYAPHLFISWPAHLLSLTSLSVGSQSMSG